MYSIDRAFKHIVNVITTERTKVQIVLKTTKRLYKHTIYLLIHMHACIVRASLCKKGRYCERNLGIRLVVIGIK